MKNKLFLYFLLVLVSTLFPTTFTLTPVQTQITATLENPKQPLTLPTATLKITPLLEEEDFSLITKTFKRINKCGGNITIHSAIMVKNVLGYSCCGSTEWFGDMYPYVSGNGNPHIHINDNNHGGKKNTRSLETTPLKTVQSTPMLQNINDFETEDKKYDNNDKDVDFDKMVKAIEDGEFEEEDILRFLSNGEKLDIHDTQFVYTNVVNKKEDMNENNKETRSFNTLNNTMSNTAKNLNSDPTSRCCCYPSVIRLGSIDATVAKLVFVNCCCVDTYYIDEITTKSCKIFNFGANIIIGKVRSDCNFKIYNYGGNIEIGNSETPRTVPAKITAELMYDEETFGMQHTELGKVINNEETDRIFCKWGTDENTEFQVFQNGGVITKYYTGDNELRVMETVDEFFTMKVDISDKWYEYPAGEYKGTIYFTVEEVE